MTSLAEEQITEEMKKLTEDMRGFYYSSKFIINEKDLVSAKDVSRRLLCRMDALLKVN